MYHVSERYTELMRAPIRECPQYARIFLGLFDNTAVDDATVTFPAEVSFSTPSNVIEDTVISAEYATFDGLHFPLDGSVQLIPTDIGMLLPQGFISAAQAGADGTFSTPQHIIIQFSTTHSMAGLTLTFGTIESDVPEQITVTTYAGVTVLHAYTVTDLTTVYQGEFLIDDADKIIITYDEVKPYNRARLNKLEFGIGYSFGSEEIVSVTEKHIDAPVSTTLPQSSLSFTLINLDNRFGVDSDTALVRFMAEGQEITVDFGVGVDGVIEWIPGGKWYLSTWTAQGINASFTAVDKIAQLGKTTFEKGFYDGNWHTMQTYAESIFTDAGVFDYYLDPFIGTLSSIAPLPISTHAEALQAVSNYAMARLFMGRGGKVSIEAVNASPVFHLTPPSSTTRYTYYSDPDGVLAGTSNNYATFDGGYFPLDGSVMLLPEGTTKVTNSGMTSKVQSDASGNFASADMLVFFAYTIQPTNVYTVTIDFGGQIPKQIAIGTGSTFRYFNPDQNVQSFSVGFEHITNIAVWIMSMKTGGQRGHLRSVQFSNVSDFTITLDEIFDQPKATLLTKLRDVTGAWVYRSYYPGVYVDVASTKVSTNTGWTRIEHDCVFSPETVMTDATVTVESQHNAFVSYVRLTAATNKEVDVTIRGQKLYEASYPLTSRANDTGEDCPVTSPLYDNVSIQSTLDWMRDYYAKRTEYELEMRGFPEVGCGDYVHLWDGAIGQIIECELSFTNSVFRQKFKIRK